MRPPHIMKFYRENREDKTIPKFETVTVRPTKNNSKIKTVYLMEYKEDLYKRD